MSTALAVRPHIEILPVPRMSFDEMRDRANIVSASGLFRMTPQQALTLMMICDCKGKHPLEAFEIYHVFDGKCELKTQFMQAKFEQAGGSIDWHTISNTEVSATFYHPQTCPRGAKITYTTEDARNAGLLGKPNWKNTTSMLSWRATKLGVNRAHSACIFGFEVPDPEDQEDAPVNPARVALVDKLSARREPAKELHAPVAEVVAELKPHEAPPVPQEAASSEAKTEVPAPADPEWWALINVATLDCNATLAELAENHPDNMGLRTAVKPHQVLNGIVKAWVEAGLVTKDRVNTDSKRDNAKVHSLVQEMWDEDRGDVEAAVARYLGGHVSKLIGPVVAAVA